MTTSTERETYLGTRQLNTNLTFFITTRDPHTGDLKGADSSPSYRVNEDDLIVPIYTGLMVEEGGVGASGLCRATVPIDAIHGFEVGKRYEIVPTATVNGITYSQLLRFEIEAPKPPRKRGRSGIWWDIVGSAAPQRTTPSPKPPRKRGRWEDPNRWTRLSGSRRQMRH